jgi:hypothetical protein
MVLGSRGLEHASAVEMLQSIGQHGPVDLSEEPRVDVYDPVWVDAEKVAIVGEVMYRAKREAVDHCRSAERIAVFDNMRGLE